MNQIDELMNKKYPTTWKMKVATFILIIFAGVLWALWIFQIANIGK